MADARSDVPVTVEQETGRGRLDLTLPVVGLSGDLDSTTSPTGLAAAFGPKWVFSAWGE